MLLLPAVAAVVLAGCGSQDNTASGSSTPTRASSSPAASASAATKGACTYTPTGDASKKVDLPPSDPAPAKSLTIKTNRGSLRATLNNAATPCTANSFTSLAKQGYFDDTKCHRLTTQGIFVLQCGDPTGSGSGGPGYSFNDELNGRERYPAGTLAMANAGPNTNGSQFFLVYADTSLPPSYTVFGKVDPAGVRVLQDIAKAGTEDGSADGPPKLGVVISSVG
jgi:peptidyl-prolyl cis-trans isomerase B (cyclophilin B)